MSDDVYYLIGSIYVIAFVVSASKWPRVALCLCFALAPNQRALPRLPYKMDLADFNLVMMFFVFCFQQFSAGRAIKWGPLAVSIAAYLGVCILASVSNWHESTTVAFAQMIPYFLFAIIVFSSYGDNLEDMKPAFYGLLIVGLFLGLSVIAARSAAVYHMNKNGVGSSFACIVVIAAELWLAATDPRRKRFFLFCMIVTVCALLITLSRGAWIGATCGIAFILLLRREFKTLFKCAALLIPLVAVLWAALPAESKEFATGFDPNRANIHSRLVFIDTASDIFSKNPVLGVGLGLRKDMDATNLILTILAETGIVGLLAFSYIHVVLFKMVWRLHTTVRRTSWTFSCLAIGGALPLVKLMHGFVDHYWSRGSLLLAWAGAGIVTRVFYNYTASLRKGVRVQQPKSRREAAAPDPSSVYPGAAPN